MTETRQNSVMVTEIHQELAQTAIERSKLYGLLAAVFQSEPTAEFLDTVLSDDFSQITQEMGVDLSSELHDLPRDELLEELAVEYTRLFLGPGKHISPHESVQLKRSSHLLWGEETVKVKLFMEDAGYILPETDKTIPDNICIELGFLSWLTASEAEAWVNGDMEQAERSLEWQHGFISRHIGKWVGGFCQAIRKQADFPYYAGFSEILRSFIAGEKKDIRDRIEISKNS